MDGLNMIHCHITPAVVEKYKELANEANITPLKMYKEGANMSGLAFIRGIDLIGAILAVPFQGQESKFYITLWVNPNEVTEEKILRNVMQQMLHNIVISLPRKDIVVSGNIDSHAGILVKAVEDTCMFRVSYHDNEFYALSTDEVKDYLCESASQPTFEGCQAGIEATWSPYVLSPKGPNMVNDALKNFIISHSNDFNAIYDYAMTKGKYSYCPLKYDLLTILEEYSTYFQDLSTYIVSILRPANTQVDCDNVDRITKAVDIDANFRGKLFSNHEITAENPLFTDSVEQLNAFINLSTFLDMVVTTFNGLPHLESVTASSIAAIINVYGYSLTEFLKRFCKELIIEFNVAMDCMDDKKPSNSNPEDFILL